MIIHIQDVHRNKEAQENIGKSIQQLIDERKLDLVALEGAFEPIDLNLMLQTIQQILIPPAH